MTFSVNTLKELIDSGYSITVYNNHGELNSVSAQELYDKLKLDDSSEIEIRKNGNYRGGAVITKDFGELDVMYVHEKSSTEVFEILK